MVLEITVGMPDCQPEIQGTVTRNTNTIVISYINYRYTCILFFALLLMSSNNYLRVPHEIN